MIATTTFADPVVGTVSLPQSALQGALPIHLHINGQDHHIQLQPWVSLLDALREYLHLTGTKKAVTTASVVPVRYW